jgi:hypothetical protein
MKKLLCLLLMLGITESGTFVHAFDPYPHRGQLSGKIFAVTVLHGCPTEELIEQVLQKGAELGADYTVISEVAAASFCPATVNGQMWSWHQIDESESGITLQFFGAETVGLHFRIVK